VRILLRVLALLAPLCAAAQTQAPPPPFPITVTSTITATRTNASARVQPRTSDIGITADIFVFALAPRARVTRPDPADTGDCVIAQLTPAGELVGVNARTMQAAFSGALPSQGVSIILINNASTPGIAGAQFFVGYGQGATQTLASGLSLVAVTIPGTPQCPATLVKSPGALSGLWWNPNESGWGMSLTQRGTTIFAAWFTYGGNGKPKWYVATCVPGAGATTNTCSGTLYEVHGPTFPSQPLDPATAVATAAGNLQLAFADNNHGTMSYVVGPAARTLSIERQPFPSSAPVLIDHTDMWWNPAESGWGAALTQKDSTIFLAWYVYDDSGNPVWYVATCQVDAGGTFASGTLFSTTGPPLGTSFDPSQVQVFQAGNVHIIFNDANNGDLFYTVGSVTDHRPITRQIF
jgi:hypothetical protein